MKCFAVILNCDRRFCPWVTYYIVLGLFLMTNIICTYLLLSFLCMYNSRVFNFTHFSVLGNGNLNLNFAKAYILSLLFSDGSGIGTHTLFLYTLEWSNVYRCCVSLHKNMKYLLSMTKIFFYCKRSTLWVFIESSIIDQKLHKF